MTWTLDPVITWVHRAVSRRPGERVESHEWQLGLDGEYAGTVWQDTGTRNAEQFYESVTGFNGTPHATLDDAKASLLVTAIEAWREE